jgi:hypothetical protein
MEKESDYPALPPLVDGISTAPYNGTTDGSEGKKSWEIHD